MPLMEDDLTLDTYIDVLRRLRCVVAAWERHLAASTDRPPDSFISERNRLPLITRDLEILSGGDFRAEVCELPCFDNSGQLMGAMYVMEGSRLGGQLIAQHVERVLELSPGYGTGYFRGFGEQTGRMWRSFIDRLRHDIPDSETEEVIRGAKKMFELFGCWMAKQSEL
jgi:heme oxygenase (biliverdin-IX-beta and delta-forming)